MPFLTKTKTTNHPSAQQSMHFWGVCCESGKQYAQVVGQRFRITMAVLDPKSSSEEVSEKTVSLIVIRGGIEYLLCVLKHDEIHQVNLNLIFDKGENVVFYINGHGKVYLSGYQLTDLESDVLDDENGYLCPLVEIKSSKSKLERKGKMSDSSDTAEVPKSKNKASKKDLGEDFWNTFVNVNENGENLDSDDDSDEDYSISNEETESEDEDDSEDFEEEEIEDELIDDEIDQDEEEEEVILDAKKSQKKRKLSKMLQPRKQSRIGSPSSSPKDTEMSEDVICLEDNGSNDRDSPGSDLMNSSIGNTPMPKKSTSETSTGKKKSKKKRLSEISNISGTSIDSSLKSPTTASTPKRPPNSSCKNPVQTLSGGVEIQDVVIGKGPVAAKGKMLHVFYVGRFQDKRIFDCRIPSKKPYSFKLGDENMIKGWTVGLQGMRVGGKRKLKIPSSMAYGNKGSKDGTIPPNSTLYFVVELHAVS